MENESTLYKVRKWRPAKHINRLGTDEPVSTTPLPSSFRNILQSKRPDFRL